MNQMQSLNTGVGRKLQQKHPMKLTNEVAAIRRILDEQKITVEVFETLLHIHDRGEVELTTLAGLCEVSCASVTKSMDILEQRGLAERTRLLSDRRKVWAVVDEGGELLLQRFLMAAKAGEPVPNLMLRTMRATFDNQP